MTLKLPVAKPSLSGNEKKYLLQALKEGYVSSRGRFVEEFEEKFAEYIGTKYSATCSSGTNALILALRALGIGRGDEVIVPEFTMVATAWAVTHVGATPVFVDCADDLNIDVDLIQDKITERTKAIIPVHVYGRPADMTSINVIAKNYDLFVIEDAAEAHGATINGTKVGALSDIACFSLFGNKIITSGEGGICTTNNKAYAEKIKYLRSMAFDKHHTFLHHHLGYNFRMTNMQAAVGLAQLEQIDEFLEKRDKIRTWYDHYLKDYTINRPIGSVLWYYDLLLQNRNTIMQRLEREGIETRLFFKPMSMQPMYLNENADYSKALLASQHGFYLPTFTDITKKEVETVCRVILGK